MRSILWKWAVGLAAAVGLVVASGNFAFAATTQSQHAALQKCVAANRSARNAAVSQFHKDVDAAHNLTGQQREDAIKAAVAKFQKAGQAAKAAFTSCVQAAGGSSGNS